VALNVGEVAECKGEVEAMRNDRMLRKRFMLRFNQDY